MFITHVLKRAWYLLWHFRALWVLGMLLALTSGFGTASVLYSDSDDPRSFAVEPWQPTMAEREWLYENLGITISPDLQVMVPDFSQTVLDEILMLAVGILILLLVGVALLILISTIIRFVAETGLIRAVDQIEAGGGAPLGIRAALRLGWSRIAWRLFAIDLVIFVALMLFMGLLLVPPAVFLPILAGIGEAALVFGIVTLFGLSIPLLLMIIFLVTSAVAFTRLCHRACALEGLGVFPAIGRAFNLLGVNVKELGALWLVMMGIELVYPVAMIPVVLVAVFVSLLLSGIVVVPTMLALVAVSAPEWTLITAGVLSALLFLFLMGIPLLFVGGLKEAYTSAAWTVGYRELTVAKPAEVEPAGPPKEAIAAAGD